MPDRTKRTRFVIKVPNDGFLYKPDSITTATNVKSYKYNDNALLAPKAGKKKHHHHQKHHQIVDASFSIIWGFIDWLFGDQNWNPQVLYNFNQETINIEAESKTKPWDFTVTFHPGYPIHRFGDHWKPTHR